MLYSMHRNTQHKTKSDSLSGKVHTDFVSVALGKNRIPDMTVQCEKGEEMCFFFSTYSNTYAHTHHIQILHHNCKRFIRGSSKISRGQ